MRRSVMLGGFCGAALAVGLLGGGANRALAQDAPNPEQMKKLYDDALGQLKAAQDRKNELAAENDRLKAQLAELQKESGRAKGELQQLRDRTYLLRAQFAAWESFVELFPEVGARWKLFLDAGAIQADWTRFEPAAAAAVEPPATQPATAPSASAAD